MAVNVDVDIGAIASAIAWPVLVGMLLIKYRKDIASFVKELSPRINKLSVGPVSIDLAEAKGFEPKWRGPGPMDVRNASIPIGSDTQLELIHHIHESTPIPIDYAIFDLGDGKQWLASRLYLFTRILYKMRRLKRIVFIDMHQGTRRHFVGIAEPNHVRYALALRYAWLEQAFAQAYCNLQNFIFPRLEIKDVNGTIDPYNAENLVIQFFLQPYIKQPQPDSALPSQNDLEKEWFILVKTEMDIGNIRSG